MSERLTLQRLRAFLRGLAAILLAGAIVELLLEGHTDGLIQLVPFGLCGLGLLALAAVKWWPGRGSARALRLTMALLIAGSLVGVAQHVAGNLDFARETRPDAATTEWLIAALTGAAPLLAPGILAVAAVLAIAATDPAGQT